MNEKYVTGIQTNIFRVNPAPFGVVGKGPSSGDKGNPPYPPLSGGQKNKIPSVGGECRLFIPPLSGFFLLPSLGGVAFSYPPVKGG